MILGISAFVKGVLPIPLSSLLFADLLFGSQVVATCLRFWHCRLAVVLFLFANLVVVAYSSLTMVEKVFLLQSGLVVESCLSISASSRMALHQLLNSQCTCELLCMRAV